jgi:hypothetical protein
MFFCLTLYIRDRNDDDDDVKNSSHAANKYPIQAYQRHRVSPISPQLSRMWHRQKLLFRLKPIKNEKQEQESSLFRKKPRFRDAIDESSVVDARALLGIFSRFIFT